MTEYQESQIRGLRMRGAGYKAIASATGLPATSCATTARATAWMGWLLCSP